jgi:hypothetical protein
MGWAGAGGAAAGWTGAGPGGVGWASATGAALAPAPGSRAAAAVTLWPSVIALPSSVTSLWPHRSSWLPHVTRGRGARHNRCVPDPPGNWHRGITLSDNRPAASPCYLLWSLCTDWAGYPSRWTKQIRRTPFLRPAAPSLAAPARSLTGAPRVAQGRITCGVPGKALTACGYTVHAPFGRSRGRGARRGSQGRLPERGSGNPGSAGCPDSPPSAPGHGRAQRSSGFAEAGHTWSLRPTWPHRPQDPGRTGWSTTVMSLRTENI